MTDFSPSDFLSELYNEHYLKYYTSKGIDPRAPNYVYTNDWCFEGTTLGFVRNQLAFEGDKITMENNYKKHYELLRLIIYESCKYRDNNDTNYIEFIQDILWILLEQEGISIAYVVPHTDKLSSILSKRPLCYIFNDKTDNSIKISNTSVHRLLKNINNHICSVIDEYKSKKTTTTSTRSTIYKTRKCGKGMKRTSKKCQKYKNSKKYRNSRKSKKSQKYNKFKK
jgi:hypothetical protein